MPTWLVLCQCLNQTIFSRLPSRRIDLRDASSPRDRGKAIGTVVIKNGEIGNHEGEIDL